MILAKRSSVSLLRYLKLVLDPQHVFNMTLKNLPKPAGKPDILPADNTDWYLADLLDAMAAGLRGNTANKAVAGFLNTATISDRTLFKYAIDRQLPGKIGRSIVNMAFPGLIYKQPYGGVKSYDPDWIERRFDWGSSVMLQEKADGLSLFLSKHTHEAGHELWKVHTRQGQDVSAALVEPFTEVFRRMPANTVFHIEGMLIDQETGELLPRVEANGRYNSVIKGEGYHRPCEYHLVILDIIDYKSFYAGKDRTPMRARFARVLDYIDCYQRATLETAARKRAYAFPCVTKPAGTIVHSVN